MIDTKHRHSCELIREMVQSSILEVGLFELTPQQLALKKFPTVFDEDTTDEDAKKSGGLSSKIVLEGPYHNI